MSDLTVLNGHPVELEHIDGQWFASTDWDGIEFKLAASDRDMAVIRLFDRIREWKSAQPFPRLNGEIR